MPSTPEDRHVVAILGGRASDCCSSGSAIVDLRSVIFLATAMSLSRMLSSRTRMSLRNFRLSLSGNATAAAATAASQSCSRRVLSRFPTCL